MSVRARIAVALTAAPAVLAQPQPRLDRVSPGVGDIGPSSVDTRIIPPDLRRPVGFEGVYRLGAPDPSSAFDARPLVRISGATLAVFPRSAYMMTRDGPLPQVPAGTVFYLGRVPDELNRPPAAARGDSLLARPLGSHALDLDFTADYTPRPPPARDAGGPARDNLFANEAFRRSRLAELLALPTPP